MDKDNCSADELRSLLGRLESTRAAVSTAALHYRFLQQMLKPLQRGPWLGSKLLSLTPGAKQDLCWWKHLSPTRSTAPMDRGSFTVDIATDASGTFGWGGHSSRGSLAQGRWFRGSDRLAYKPESVGFSRILSEGAHVVGRSCKSLGGQHL